MFIAEPQSHEDFEKYYLLRWQVLRQPWNQPRGSETDDMEENSIHAMVCDDQSNVLGVCRLQYNSKDEGQIRYMGVRKDMQGKGIGKKLLNYLEQKALHNSCKKIILHSRENALDFYKSSGYTVKEKSYLMWDQIQHFLMEKKLD